ncbi:MAG: cellulase family glycosylhydrolase [Eubacterium sp.]|nr:cellulase family glycosylhydrolase [Eubacterium sp.]
MDKISVSSKQFIDEYGRERIFCGVNMGGKITPFMNTYTNAESKHILKNHIKLLHTHGFNVIRFFVNWSYLEPMPKQYDENVLNGIKEFLDICKENGIYVYLDMHQDLYSSFRKEINPTLHGNGAPKWACITNGKKFKQPKRIWAEGYFTGKAVHNAFNNFWNNAEVEGQGLQEHFCDLWRMLAKRFGTHPAILGFDIFNEPFPYTYDKNIFFIIVKSAIKITLKNRNISKRRLISSLLKKEPLPTLLSQYSSKILYEITSPANKYIEKFDKEKYSPFINKVTAAIREVTDNGIIFMENCYYSNMGIPFSAPPITVNYNREKNQAFSPHAYDLLVDTPFYKYADNERVGATFKRRKCEQEKLNIPVLVGEWGGGTMIPDWFDHANYLLNLFDSFKWSHTYWCFNPVIFNSPLMNILCRVHPIAVCGKIESYHFDKENQRFILSFNQDKDYNVPTEIFCHTKPKKVKAGGAYAIKMLDDIHCILLLTAKQGHHTITIEF